jgi:hypothetical protein
VVHSHNRVIPPEEEVEEDEDVAEEAAAEETGIGTEMAEEVAEAERLLPRLLHILFSETPTA